MPASSTTRSTGRWVLHFLGAILGLDASIRLSRHVVLVPQLRKFKTVANWRGPNLGRVGIALRWRL
jgi:hypothetical protein